MFVVRVRSTFDDLSRLMFKTLNDGEVWLTFEQLTLVPIQRKLIDEDLLDRDEVRSNE